MPEIVIVGAKRTAVGSFLGAFASLPAHELGSIAIAAAVKQARVEPADIDEVIMGQVLTAGQGQNPARQASMAAGIPQEVPAWGVNMVCGSGLRAIALGAEAIASGAARIVVAGGQESMSRSTHVQYLRGKLKIGNLSLVDTMLQDGLTDAFGSYHMGVTAEHIASSFGITRLAQDEFAVASQNKAEAAQRAGRFEDEIAPVVIGSRKGEMTIAADEYIRMGADLAGMGSLRPAFKKDGTVTAGNASGINDGAAALVLMTADNARHRGLTPLARVRSWASAGVDPAMMGIGPVPAVRKALRKAGWTIDDLELVEANEAFAAQAIAVCSELDLPAHKVNVNGGSIAIGHPIGASGARILNTLIYEMRRRDAHRGMATLCVGGGMGIAMCIERCAEIAGSTSH